MATITALSIEAIYIILEQKIIDIKDVINFSLTCRRFNDALDNNLLWRTKLYQSFDIRWPHLKKIYDNRIQNKESINFKDEVKANVKCRKALLSYLSLLSEKLFNHESSQSCKPSDSDIEIFDILFRPNIGARTMNYYFLKDELLHQIEMSPLDPKCNLMQQYYSKKVLPLLQRRHLEDVWLEFLNYPKEQQLFENVATIVAQWYQPKKRIYDFDIKASLDDIAQQTLNSLKKAHCDHPIFSTSAKQFSFWKYNNIDNNQWSKIEEMQIINVLRTVLFDELGFHLDNTPNLDNTPKPETLFIDCVLESRIGNHMILAIIFQSILRRLGVRCDIAHSRFSWLCWKPKSIAENPEDKEYFYINIYTETIQDRRKAWFIGSYNEHKEICPIRMVFLLEFQWNCLINLNFFRSMSRSMFISLITKSLDSLNEMLYRNCYRKISISHISFMYWPALQNDYSNRKSVEALRRTKDILRIFEILILMSVQRMNANLQISRNRIVPKTRTRDIKFAVGMIVTCIKNDPNQTGVIIGWDEKFNSHAKEKYNSTTVLNDSQTCDTAEQPFYIILSEDGNVYYAAEDTLIPASPRWIQHSEIGRYFCRFTNSYYVPNEVLTRHYPYDQAIILIQDDSK